MILKRKYEVSSSEIRKLARQVLAFRKRICANCNFDEYVECCHIKPISSFPKESFVHDINSPENLVFLCPNCHKLMDSGKLTPEESWTNIYIEEIDDVL